MNADEDLAVIWLKVGQRITIKGETVNHVAFGLYSVAGMVLSIHEVRNYFEEKS